MKKTWIAVLIILVIIAGVIYLYLSNIGTRINQNSPDKIIQSNGNTVYILNFSFAPEVITIKKGDDVVWINQDVAIHQVKFSESIMSLPLGIGESYSHNFTQNGTFDYSCAIHPSMKGKVIVQ